MKLPFESLWQRNFSLVIAQKEHGAAMAGLHIDGFHRPWSDGEFRALLSQENVFGFLVLVEGKPKAPAVGFILARLVAGEAEILSVTVAKSVRRQGLGYKLVAEVLRILHEQRAESLFLEVDSTNLPAINLYRRFGFKKVGERLGYYDKPEGKTSALVMRLDLG
jgi:[ribosomal protein S18]-alanine N-acetyltransferase